MNTNLIHKWLRDPRFAPECDEECVLVDEASDFLPIEIEGAMPVPSHPDLQVSAQRVDITLSDGRRILVEGNTALSAVLSLVEGLMP